MINGVLPSVTEAPLLQKVIRKISGNTARWASFCRSLMTSDLSDEILFGTVVFGWKNPRKTSMVFTLGNRYSLARCLLPPWRCLFVPCGCRKNSFQDHQRRKLLRNDREIATATQPGGTIHAKVNEDDIWISSAFGLWKFDEIMTNANLFQVDDRSGARTLHTNPQRASRASRDGAGDC